MQQNSTLIPSGTNMTEAHTSQDCAMQGVTYGTLVLIFFSVPLQIMIIKALCKDLGFALPRHKLLLSLNISDSLFVVFIALLSLILHTSNSPVGSTLCLGLRKVMLGVGVLSTIVSSSMITALSFERYVCCMHCFYIHEILTSKRVAFSIALSWLIATVLAFVSSSLDATRNSNLMVGDATMVILSTIVVFTSITIAVVQTRLFLLSRQKIWNEPSHAFGEQAEEGEMRKKEVKIAISASVVALAYILCMLPAAIIFLLDLSSLGDQLAAAKKIAVPFGVVNNLLNPIIYGFGMADTREAMIKTLKNLRAYCTNIICNMH